MWLILGVLVLLPFIGLVILSVLSRQAPELGLVDGRLRVCPKGSRNCVCSQSEANSVEPIPYSGSAEDALKQMETIIERSSGGSVIERSGEYLRAEFRTPLLRFVDDLELLADTERHIIHVRSASRVGKSDFGANRERVESLRREFENKAAK